MTLKEIRHEFGCAGDLAACGPPMRLIVTITRADEVRRVKSRFSRPVILRVFPHNRTFGGHCELRYGCRNWVEVRGRDVHCWTPPAQIRTSPIRASGSYLGGVTAKRRSGACRTRSSAWVTRARLWVRCVLCWSAFPLVPALGSTASAAGVPVLFDGFTATMAESDFS